MDDKERLEELKEHIDECIEQGMPDKAMQDLKDNAMACLSGVPTTITLNQFKKLKHHIKKRFTVLINEDGDIDLDQCHTYLLSEFE